MTQSPNLPPKRARGAQMGNRNACKANRQAKALSNSISSENIPQTPIPANIEDLLDREVRLLARLMDRLEACLDQQEQEMTEDDLRKTMRAITYATHATLNILRARQIQPKQEKTLHDYLNEALTQLDAENEAEIAQKKPRGSFNPSPLFGSA